MTRFTQRRVFVVCLFVCLFVLLCLPFVCFFAFCFCFGSTSELHIYLLKYKDARIFYSPNPESNSNPAEPSSLAANPAPALAEPVRQEVYAEVNTACMFTMMG